MSEIIDPAQRTAPDIREIGQIAITVSNVQAAKAFYTGVLGLRSFSMPDRTSRLSRPARCG